VIDLVGHGTFGQVVKCDDVTNRCQVAIKIIKNKPAYYNQAFMEIRLLKLLNDQCDPNDENHIVRLKVSSFRVCFFIDFSSFF
jgi:dual specificity protein kinase YAK1